MNEEAIFTAALDIADPDERAIYVSQTCAGNATLRLQVEALLAAHDRPGEFLDVPALLQIAEAESESRQSTADTNAQHGSAKAEIDLSFLQPSTNPGSLGRLRHYEVQEVIGRGGCGIVLKAFDEMLHRTVAIKVMAPELAATSPARKGFLREARAAAAVRHEHVISIHSVEEQPIPFLVMEYIAGQTLQQKLDQTGPLDVLDVLRIGHQIACGLEAAHAMGLIHRDIKPANILLENRAGGVHVKITDFGVARASDDASLTQSGAITGTPLYMSPEQAQGDTIDQRSDLFSFGSVLYVMCSGRPPFRAPTMLAVLKRVAEDQPRAIQEIIPEVPDWLTAIISRLHAKRAADRFDSAHQVAGLLARCLSELQLHGWVEPPEETLSRTSTAANAAAETIPSVSPRVEKQPVPALKRRRWAVAAVVVGLLIAGLGMTEATGVTNLQGTVIRLFSPDGTLVVEVDDPRVSVGIEGGELVITGAGVREIRLKPGQYTMLTSKDGKPLRQELVTITHNDRKVVRVSKEVKLVATNGNESVPERSTRPAGGDGAKKPLAFQTPGFDQWVEEVAGLPAEQQVEAVRQKLVELNPGFEGRITGFAGNGTPKIENGVVTQLGFDNDHGTRNVTDISPLRALRGLSWLWCGLAPGQLEDLSPLKGMQLVNLVCPYTKISDLSPLAGMKLEVLDCAATPVTDLSPLEGMPLGLLCAANTPVCDISKLRGMTSLRRLMLTGTRVTDLSSIEGMQLDHFTCQGLAVSDLSLLKAMPLKYLFCDFKPERDTELLRSIKTLVEINGKPVAEFWNEVEEENGKSRDR